MRAFIIAAFGALAIAGAFSIEPAAPGAAVAFSVPAGPQSFPEAEDVKQGCCSWHGGVCGCNANTGHQLCCDGQDSPSCGC